MVCCKFLLPFVSFVMIAISILGKCEKNLIESSQKNPIDTLPDSFKILQILARQLQEFPTNIHP